MILDGKIIEADRCREKTISVKGEVIDLWYSGEAHAHGGNIAAGITRRFPAVGIGCRAWLGARHHRCPPGRRCPGCTVPPRPGLQALADAGYDGAGIGVHIPVRQPADGRELDIDTRTRNAIQRSLRCLGERGFALLTTRWRALQHVTASPSKIGSIARAALVITDFEYNDGASDNRSWNCGAEGATADPAILGLRARQSRAMLATLMLSSGVPLLLGGDEMGRTQQGNNNAYCQDNEISWVDWSRADTQLLDFTRRLFAIRKAHPVFRRRFLGDTAPSELRWFTPGGTEMRASDWPDASTLAIALYLDGSGDCDQDAAGTPLLDDDFLVLVNGRMERLEFALPATRNQAAWRIELDTHDPAVPGSTAAAGRAAGDHITVGPGSIVVLSDRA